MGKINAYINRIITELNVKAVMPIINLPYYCGVVPADGGVTSFCLLDNGHFTLHSFPFYGACYIDMMFSNIDGEKAKAAVNDIFAPEKTDMWLFDRDCEKCNADYSPKTDFGPHVLVKAAAEKDYPMGDIYTILESLPEKLGMHAITRPTVVTNRIKDYTVISGIIIIAESHISFHYDLSNKTVYFDMYSCKFCDEAALKGAVDEIFTSYDYQLISRGKKLSSAIKPVFTLSENKWRDNI